jgi:hypothetical protein
LALQSSQKEAIAALREAGELGFRDVHTGPIRRYTMRASSLEADRTSSPNRRRQTRIPCTTRASCEKCPRRRRGAAQQRLHERPPSRGPHKPAPAVHPF